MNTTTRFERLLEAVPDALVGMDQKGVIRFVNRETESLFGYDRDDLIGQHIETLLPAPLWQIYASHREDYFADRRTRSSGLDLELKGRRKDDDNGFLVNISMSQIDTGDVLLVITAVRDVAQRKQAVRNAELIAAIVKYSDDAIVGSTLEGVVTSWNPAAERMYGYSSKEIIGRSASLLAPEDRDGELDANLARVKAGEAVGGLETMSVRKDGSVVPVSVTVAPIHDEGGVIVGASVVHRDVSEQRRVFEIAQRMEAIVKSSTDAIIGKTVTGIITSWNPAAERMYGYASEEIIGKSISVLIPRDRIEEMDAILARIKEGQDVQQLETIRVRKDGTEFPVSVTVSPIHDLDGAIVGASAIQRDVTDQRRAFEEAQRMEALVESSADAIVGQTLTGIITSWNPAAERTYGYASEEIIGKSISVLIPKDRSNEMEDNLARIKAGRQVERLETTRVRKDGTVFPISLSVSPICDPGGAIVGASGIGRDLTELEHAAHYARNLIEADLDALVAISPEGRINDVNEAAVNLTGVPREALIGSEYAQYVTEPDKAIEIFEQVFEQGSVKDYPLTFLRRDDTVTDVLCNLAVYRDAGGKVLGVLASGREVTKQKEAFEVSQRLAAIVEGSDDAIISDSVDGNITSWNPAAERMFGYSRAEILGKPAEILAPEDRAQEVRTLLAKIGAGRPVARLQSQRVRKDGRLFPVSLTVSPIQDSEGALVGASVIYRERTENE